MGIVDADHGRLTGRGGGDGVDDAADQLQPVTIGVGCPGGNGAQRQGARRGGADDPTCRATVQRIPWAAFKGYHS